MPLDPDIGRVIRSSEVLHPPVNPLRANSLPSMDPESFWRELELVERDVEIGLRERFGSRYLEHWDPFRMHISKLTQEEQESAIARIDRLTGAQSLWEQGIGPVMFRDYKSLEGQYERSPAGRMPFAREEFAGRQIDPRILAISQQTIRFDRGRYPLPHENYFSAGTQYRPHVLRHIQQQLEGGIQTPGKTVIFDVETPGLDPNEGVWQVSARVMGPDQEILDRTFHFRNPKMQWGGIIGPEGQNLQDFLSGQEVGDYPEQMKQFLQMMEGAQTIGGHNIFFDYDMLSRGLKKNAAYRNDPEYRRLVDTFHEAFYNKHTGQIGNIIDTNVLARALLPDIALAPELVGGPMPYQFGLQNILLQTNLLNRVKAAEGDEAVSQRLSRGLHYADVDVPFESHLLRALQEHQQYLRGEGGQAIQFGNFLTPEERRAILYSRPIGPNIPLSQLSQIHPQLRRRAQNAGLIDFDAEGHIQNIRLTPMEQMVALQRDLTMGPTGTDLYRPTPSGWKNEGSFFKRMKRALWDIETPTQSPLEYGNQIGMWDRISKDWRTQGGLIAREAMRPTDATWRAVQQEYADKGVPLAGMSWLERHIASLLGEAGSRQMSTREREVRHIFGGDAASLGRFVEPIHGIDVVGRSEIAAVPISYLEQWEKSRIAAGEAVSTAFTRPFEEPQFLYLSPFRHTQKTTDEVALMLELQEEEKSSLLNFLTHHPDLEGNDAMVRRLSSAFAHNTGTYGIQVGTLGGVKGGEDTSRVANAIRQLAGIGADKSDQTPMFWTAYAGRNLTGEEGVYTAGTFMKRELLTPQERAAIPKAVESMTARYRSLNEGLNQGRMLSFFRTVKQRGATGDEGVARMYRNMQVMGKRAPLFAAGAAAAGGAYYLYRRSQRNKVYDETMAVQPVEASGWYQRNKANEIPANPRVRPDYLQTAKIVRNLDANKINHTSMAPNKYDYLFQTGV